MKFNGILQINDTLNSLFWENDRFSPAVRDKLLKIAENFFDNLGLDTDIDDITITGSMANFNWTKYSDIDLHLIVDFSQIDENLELVREYFSSKTSNWNKDHDISFYDYDVEIYVQDVNEIHRSSGVYSILNDEWLIKPTRVEPKVDVKMVKKKANSFIDMIDRAEDMYYDKDYEEAHKFSLRMIKRIKKYRQSGLESGGEYSNENLVFKYLRNNKHTDVLFDVRNMSYDKMMSIEGKPDKKFKIFMEKDKLVEKSGFNRLDEIGKFQRRVQAKHNRLKYLNIGKGKQNPGKAYPNKPSYKRSKSAPVGFGGA